MRQLYTIAVQFQHIIKNALDEDIGTGDVTTLATLPDNTVVKAKIFAKEAGVVAGMQIAELVFKELDPRIVFSFGTSDGKSISKGETIAVIEGPGRAILSAERVALNFLQRMSGIATQTRRFVEAVKGTKAIILDTRKTAPGLRVLDKWAVRLGGGQNHRNGLYDAVLLKENHIAAAGGITEAISRTRTSNKTGERWIEVEVRNLTELREAIEAKPDRILLDNMSLEDISLAVQTTAGKIPLEVSGNITLENVADVAAAGVDYISIGLLTHSVKALDLSLIVFPQQ